MIKQIIVGFCLLISLTALAQEGTSSPYSFYGIGEVRFKGTVDTRSMGGINVFPDSIHMNIQNPAHLASLKLTNYFVGGTYANTKSKTETQEEKARRTTLDYLGVGIPIGKLGIGFGLIPYSSVGYKIQNLSNDANPIYSRYNGLGGVTKVFVAAGYKLNKNFNIGIDFQYNFGTINTSSLRYQSQIQYGTRENNLSTLQGVNFDFGLTYQTKLNKKLSFFSSLSYSPEGKINLTNTRNIEIVQFLSSGAISVIQTQAIAVDNTSIKLPSKISLGSGFGEPKKWLVGGEITFSKTSAITNRFTDFNGSTFENAVRYSLGGYFVPNYNSYSNYLKKITYRGGLRYENTGLVIGSKSITDFAVTTGLGLPVGGSFSNINLGLEIGKRGTMYNNLIEENYINISVGLSLSDKWFVKRKFN